MLNSRILLISINRPYTDVRAFLTNPLNFLKWAANFGSEMEPVGEREYLVEVPSGELILRFSPPNDFGVFDYVAYRPGSPAQMVTPVRLYANDEGADLIYTMWHKPGVSDEQFASDETWLRSDLDRLKTLLESRKD